MAGWLLFFFFPSTHQRKFKWETTCSEVLHQPRRLTPHHGSLTHRAGPARSPRPRGRRAQSTPPRARQAAALTTPGMLRGPSAPARGPNVPDLGPATEPLTQGAPGPHLHVAPKDELDRSSQSSDYSTKLRASWVGLDIKFPKRSAIAGKTLSSVTVSVRVESHRALYMLWVKWLLCSLRQHIY